MVQSGVKESHSKGKRFYSLIAFQNIPALLINYEIVGCYLNVNLYNIIFLLSFFVPLNILFIYMFVLDMAEDVSDSDVLNC